MTTNRPLVIVEDSDEDFEVTVWALRQAGVDCPIVRYARAESALEHLLPASRPAQEPRPSLILLDLNLPGTDGRELLQTLRTAGHPTDVPIVVLSTSSNPGDVGLCYRLGAAGYLCKPLSLELFIERMCALANYWFHTVALPPAHG